MAARTLKPRHQDDIRAKIKVAALVNFLENLGERGQHGNSVADQPGMAVRVRAAEILLKKCLPDLSAVDHSGEIEQRHSFAVPIDTPDTRSPDDWARVTVQ